ncbi:MAG: hypothetical protein H7Y00_06585, partial [Fimbriimonadaceae bacterium]|nr:hypothetical protein [Chitinophagales bacterium]
MKVFFTYRIAIFFLIYFIQINIFAQAPPDVVQVEDGKVIIKIDKRNKKEYQNLLLYFGLNEDSLFNYGNIGLLAKEGWVLQRLDKHVAEIALTLSEDINTINWGNEPIFFDMHPAGTPGYPVPVLYGYNNFKTDSSVFENNKNETVFILNGNTNAEKVYLSGNFNNWSTMSTPMQKTDKGWTANLNLKPGKYFYKFIIDGKWIYDPHNNLKEPDGHDSFNSTYFKYNYTFRLKGYTDKKNVTLTGSFNN